MRKQKDNSGRRIAVLSGILAAVILLYSVRLVDWQLIHKDKYEAQSIANVATYIIHKLPLEEKFMTDTGVRSFKTRTAITSFSIDFI